MNSCKISIKHDNGKHTNLHQCTDVRPNRLGTLGVYSGTFQKEGPLKIGDTCQVTMRDEFSFETTLNGGFISYGEGVRCNNHSNHNTLHHCRSLREACNTGNDNTYHKMLNGKIEAAQWGPFNNFYAICVPNSNP